MRPLFGVADAQFLRALSALGPASSVQSPLEALAASVRVTLRPRCLRPVQPICFALILQRIMDRAYASPAEVHAGKLWAGRAAGGVACLAV